MVLSVVGPHMLCVSGGKAENAEARISALDEEGLRKIGDAAVKLGNGVERLVPQTRLMDRPQRRKHFLIHSNSGIRAKQHFPQSPLLLGREGVKGIMVDPHRRKVFSAIFLVADVRNCFVRIVQRCRLAKAKQPAIKKARVVRIFEKPSHQPVALRTHLPHTLPADRLKTQQKQ